MRSRIDCRDHAEERTWRHLDTCQFKTFIHASIPRVDCPEHGVRQAKVPWAEPKSRFTLLMERMVIDVLMACSTIEGARRLLRLSWDEAWGVMERAVRRGMGRKEQRRISYLGVDEKAFRKEHSYMTVVCDLMRGTVEHVAEKRRTSSLEGYHHGHLLLVFNEHIGRKQPKAIRPLANNCNLLFAIQQGLKLAFVFFERGVVIKIHKHGMPTLRTGTVFGKQRIDVKT